MKPSQGVRALPDFLIIGAQKTLQHRYFPISVNIQEFVLAARKQRIFLI